MNIIPQQGISFDDVLLVPQRSTVTDLEQVDISTQVCGVDMETPIISANMDTVTETDMAAAMSDVGGLGIIHRFNSIDQQEFMVNDVSNYGADVGAAVGVGDDGVERAERMEEAGADFVCIDVAHGHLGAVVARTETLKEKLDIPVMAGNIATYTAAEELMDAGADALKVGIGPGSHCTTRVVTGAGVPQLTAINDVSLAVAHTRPDTTVIADGGIKSSGDIVKALMAGADAVMLGGLLMGTDESAARPVEGESYYLTRGMASNEARRDAGKEERTSEGVEGKVVHKGTVEDVVTDLNGGIRSGISYCGGHSITAARGGHLFMRVTPATQQRNSYHGIQKR